MSAPRISVVIAARDSHGLLRRCLAALSATEYDSFECIIVDDSSADPLADVVDEFGFRCIRPDAHLGPAAARNLGAQEAHGPLLFFTDADIEVRPNTLAQVARRFDADPHITAVIGSYDDAPAEQDFFSQYRNLVHHFVHQRGNEAASTFWSGCGAIRRDFFEALGGFDAAYKRPAIEDIELGGRIRDAGGRILLDKTLFVKHLKKWSLGSIVVTDIRDRGFPWSMLLATRREMPNDLNISVSQRVSVALCCAAVLMWAAGIVVYGGWFWLPAIHVLATAFVGPLWYGPGARDLGVLGRAASAMLATVLLGLLAVSLLLSARMPLGACVAVAASAAFALNAGLLRFFFRSRGPLFAAASVPFLLLHQVGSGLSFAAAHAVCAARNLSTAIRQIATPGRPVSR